MEIEELKIWLTNYKLQKRIDTQNGIYPIKTEELKILIDKIPDDVINTDANGGTLKGHYTILTDICKDEPDELYELYLCVKLFLEPNSLLIKEAPEYELHGIGNLDIDDFYLPDEPSVSNKIGRNETCPCGSFKKYKKCCI